MREFTAEEMGRLERGQCPVCGCDAPQWRVGPAGGASRNLEMACCDSTINVVDPERYGWPPPAITGQVIRERSAPPSLH